MKQKKDHCCLETLLAKKIHTLLLPFRPGNTLVAAAIMKKNYTEPEKETGTCFFPHNRKFLKTWKKMPGQKYISNLGGRKTGVGCFDIVHLCFFWPGDKKRHLTPPCAADAISRPDTFNFPKKRIGLKNQLIGKTFTGMHLSKNSIKTHFRQMSTYRNVERVFFFAFCMIKTWIFSPQLTNFEAHIFF